LDCVAVAVENGLGGRNHCGEPRRHRSPPVPFSELLNSGLGWGGDAIRYNEQLSWHKKGGIYCGASLSAMKSR
jgi:hypothetical protein